MGGKEIFFLCKFQNATSQHQATMQNNSNPKFQQDLKTKHFKNALFPNASKALCMQFFTFVFFQLECKNFLNLIKKKNLQTKNQQTTSKGCRILVVMHQSTLQCLYRIKNPKLGKKI
jgi:hypothetical protein